MSYHWQKDVTYVWMYLYSIMIDLFSLSLSLFPSLFLSLSLSLSLSFSLSLLSLSLSLFLPDVFGDCYSTVTLDPYYESCLYDMCATNLNSSVLCNIVEVYATRCQLQTDWKRNVDGPCCKFCLILILYVTFSQRMSLNINDNIPDDFLCYIITWM